jgi:hypothetical protein
VLLGPVLVAESLGPHVGDLQVRFQRPFEMLQLVREIEDLGDFLSGQFETDWFLIVWRFFVNRTAILA